MKTILKKIFVLSIFLGSLFLSPNILFGEKVKICLTMIVKNEEKTIERCLNSVKDIIDFISICDTGSEDRTVQIIEEYLKKEDIPGKVFKNQWKNFGHNRTLSVQTAQKTIEELGFPLENTYLLLLDADMILKIDPSFSKDDLIEDSYSFIQKNHAYSYYNTRLIRASLPWHSIGVTHEYWSCKIPIKESKLQTLNIDDRDDGGSKTDKFERDIKLLTEGLKNEPDNVRYLFYLAQSYKSLNNFDEAIKWYKSRIEKGGWKEEVWFSKLMIGECFEAQDKWEQAFLAYLEAYQYNPDRAEPLQKISTHYRLKENYDLAYLFAKQGSQIPYPSNQVLFIFSPAYDYLLDQDLSIAAYYTPFKEEGYAAANRLMLKKNIPSYIKELAYRNMLYYVPHLNFIKLQSIEIDLPLIREGLSARYNPMNPSIQKTKDGYDVICRTVNYMQIGAKHFKSLDIFDSTNKAKTRNFLVQYDKKFHLLSQKEIIEELPRNRRQTLVEGLEDCRMFEFNKSTWFTCTTLDTNPFGSPQVSLCKLSDDRNGSSIYVEKLIPLIGPDIKRCEKNWLPFVKDNEIFVIYSFDPFFIYKPNLELGNCILYDSNSPNYDFSRFSGSAPPIEFDDGYLLLVHETVYNDQRNYMHRFIFLDKNFNINKISKPFIFLHKGVEYCCGMVIDHSLANLVMAIGIEDREAYLGIIDLNTVRSLLENLP